MKDTKIKNFTQEFETIEQFENYKNQKVIIENCDGEAFIKKSKRNFKLSFDGIFSYKSDKKIKVHINSTEFIFKSIDFKEPINEVFEAIVNPEKMTNYFISKSTGIMEEGKDLI